MIIKREGERRGEGERERKGEGGRGREEREKGREKKEEGREGDLYFVQDSCRQIFMSIKAYILALIP